MYCPINYVITDIKRSKQNWIAEANGKVIKIIPMLSAQLIDSVSIAEEMGQKNIGPKIYEHGICTKGGIFNFSFVPSEEVITMLTQNQAVYVMVMEKLIGEHPNANTSKSDWLKIAETLGKMHALGILHNDLHPGNIVITPQGVRFIDFDMATRTQSTPQIMFLIDTRKFMYLLQH